MRVPAFIQRLFAPGYGYCMKCHRPWKYVKNHSTEFTVDGQVLGAFPLCESCWTKLRFPALRIYYYRRLWEKWMDDAVTVGDAKRLIELERYWDSMAQAVWERR